MSSTSWYIEAATIIAPSRIIIRMQNGELVTVFRQAPAREGTGIRQDRNEMAMVAQLSSGELIVNTHRWLVSLTEEQAADRASGPWVMAHRQEHPAEGVLFDSLYLIRFTDVGLTWGEPQPVSISSLAYRSHTGKKRIIEMPDGPLLLPLDGRATADQRDGGVTWGDPSTVAHGPQRSIAFEEPAMLRLPNGRLLTVIRTAAGTRTLPSPPAPV